MFVIPLIQRKRDGGSLTAEEWRALVHAYAGGEVPDYQMSALLMAVVCRGLEDAELAALTDAMCASGARLAFGPGVPPRVDKHSTGGVGDKVSLVLAPLAAAIGIAVPMISGRGLGHTGGTLDKLLSIPGFRVDLSLEEARRQVERLGVAMLGQTEEIAPADRKLYALRDATGTVEAIPLMAASIMSKKLAEGLDGLVLDVKRGSGAFLPHLEDGLTLARTMVRLGEERHCPTVALLTAMDRPLGRTCGNALEVVESIEALRDTGPSDLMEVVLQLGSEMALLAGVADTREAARRRLEEAVASGAALEKLRAVVQAQGGDPRVLDEPDRLPRAPIVREYVAPLDGFVVAVEPRAIGEAVVAMGGGRQVMEDPIDPAVGLVCHVRPGDRVERGVPLASIHARDDRGAALASTALETALVLGPQPPEPPLPLVSHRVTSAGVEVLA